MTEGTYRLDLDKIPITLATLPQMEVMYGFHERFSWIMLRVLLPTFDQPVLQQIGLLPVSWIVTPYTGLSSRPVKRAKCIDFAPKSRTNLNFLQKLFPTCNNFIRGWKNAQHRFSGHFPAPETDHNILQCSLFVTPKFYISIVLSFSGELKWPQEKLKTMLMQNLGWQTKNIMVCYGIFWSGQCCKTSWTFSLVARFPVPLSLNCKYMQRFSFNVSLLHNNLHKVAPFCTNAHQVAPFTTKLL